jgi:Envelope integrity protein A
VDGAGKGPLGAYFFEAAQAQQAAHSPVSPTPQDARGVEGSAYFIGGFGMTALTANDVVVVPIRAGVGLRLGANIGYLKFTPESTWNPF